MTRCRKEVGMDQLGGLQCAADPLELAYFPANTTVHMIISGI